MSGGGPRREPTQTGAAWPSHLEEMQRATWAYARITRAAPPAVLLCLVAWLTLGAGLFLGSPLAGRITMLLAVPVWIALVAASRKLRPPAVVADEDLEEARSRKRYVRSIQVVEATVLLVLFWGWRSEPAVAAASILGLSICVVALPVAWMAAVAVLRSTADARLGLLLAVLGAMFVVPRDEVQLWPVLFAATVGLWLAVDAVRRGLERRRISQRLAAVRETAGLQEPEPPPEARAQGPGELRRAIKEYEEQANRRGLEMAAVGGSLLARLFFDADASPSRILILASPLAWAVAAWISSRLYPKVERPRGSHWMALAFGAIGAFLLHDLANATWYSARLSCDAAVAIGLIEVILVLIAVYQFADGVAESALWFAIVPIMDMVRQGAAYGVWSVLGGAFLVIGTRRHLRFRAVQRRLRSLEGRPEGREGGQP